MSEYDAFISYSRKDKQIAKRLYHDLNLQNLKVFIDSEGIGSENIANKIAKATSESKFLICLVSKNSLCSPWVSEEIVMRRALDNAEQQNNIIPCHIDTDFLQDDTYQKIDQASSEQLVKICEQRNQLSGQSTAHLDIQHERLVKLKNNLSAILAYLREHNSMPLNEGVYEQTFLKIYTTITGEQELVVTLTTKPSFINERIDEVQNLIARNKLPQASNRLLDYVKEFIKEEINSAIIISQKLNLVDSLAGSEKLQLAGEVIQEALNLLTIAPKAKSLGQDRDNDS